MVEIIPAILVKTEQEFRERFAKIEPLVSWAQLDVVDGRFAPNVTWGDTAVIASLETSVRFEIDLMVQNNEEAVGRWLSAVPQVGRVIFHVESLSRELKHQAQQALDLIETIREAGIEAAMSINPETAADALFPFCEKLDAVLLLGVSPGFGGQELHQDVIKKIAQLREKFADLPIEVDGGVNAENAGVLAKAGATRLAAGSFLFAHPGGPATALEELRVAANI